MQRLGMTEDLLPVVSAPGVEIHAQSKLKDLGKTPSFVGGDGFVVGIPGWTRKATTDRQVGRWSTDGRLGICVQTRRVRAIDIDIGDAHQAGRVRELVELQAGHLPVRWREGSGKCLMAFSMDCGEMSKRILRTEHGLIEFLATGQQFIAFGRHHTGVQYQWSEDDISMLEVLGGFPEMSLADFEALWQGLADVFAPGEDASVTARRGVAPSVARSKLDMHGDPVVAFLDENGWVKDYDRDGRVHVRCPWEGEHTSDSGSSATTYFPAGVGGFSQGHWRCLHDHCAGRGDGEWHEAIGYQASMFDDLTKVQMQDDGSVVELPAVRDWGPLPKLTKVVIRRKSVVESTMDNVVKAVGHPGVCGHQLAYDAFRDEVMVAGAEEGAWRPVRDSTYVDLRVALERHGFNGVGKELVRDALQAVAERNQIDSAIQWVESLRWDGVDRIEQFLMTYLGVKDTPYARAVGRYMWTALAGRALVPGVKADMVPVLLGGQGIKKTTLVESLAPLHDAFVEIDLAARDADLARSLRGKLVGEIAELRGLTTRDSESIKAWITRRHEEWVPKWRETTTRFRRRLLLIGTGNNPEFLDDSTGERRWLPVQLGSMIDVASIERDRDQLWAEGAALFVAGGVDWQDAQDLAAGVHAAHKVHDEWEDPIADWLRRDAMDMAEGVLRAHGEWTLAQVAVGALGLEAKSMARKEELRIGKVLRRLGFDKRVVWRDGRAAKRWALADGGLILGLR